MIPKIDEVVEVKVHIKVDMLSRENETGIKFSGYVVDKNGEKPKRGAAYVTGLNESMIVEEE